MYQTFLLVLQAVGIATVILFLLHKYLVSITPVERRLNRAIAPLPPSANVKEKPSNNETYSVVVGGSGFMGSFITSQLVSRGDKVRVFDIAKGKVDSVEYITASIMNEDKLVEAFRDAKVVFHTASILDFANVPRSYEINVVGTQHVVNACIRAGVTRLVYTSSVAVLMDGTDILSGDESTLSYSKTHLTPYGTTKALAEKIVLKANGVNGLRTCALRPPGMFGPGDVFFTASLSKPNLPILNGPVVQDWMYVENAAHCHVLAGDSLTDKSPVPGNYYFIGDGGLECTEFCNSITRPLGLPDKYVVPKKYSYPLAVILQTLYSFSGGYFTDMAFRLNTGVIKMSHLNLHVSTAKAEKDFGYKPLFTLDEGIKKTVADLRKDKK